MESPALVAREDTHRSAVEPSSVQAWLQRFAQAALHCFARHRSRLDLDEAPDVMKRDLGFLDGCAPYREDVRLR